MQVPTLSRHHYARQPINILTPWLLHHARQATIPPSTSPGITVIRHLIVKPGRLILSLLIPSSNPPSWPWKQIDLYLFCCCQPNPQLPPSGELLHVSKVLRHSGAGIAGNERRAVVDVLQKLLTCLNHAFYGRSHLDSTAEWPWDSCFPWAGARTRRLTLNQIRLMSLFVCFETEGVHL